MKLWILALLFISHFASAKPADKITGTGSTPIKCGLGLIIKAIQAEHLKGLKRTYVRLDKMMVGDGSLVDLPNQESFDQNLGLESAGFMTYSFNGSLERSNGSLVPISGRINFSYENRFDEFGEKLPTSTCSSDSLNVENSTTRKTIAIVYEGAH